MMLNLFYGPSFNGTAQHASQAAAKEGVMGLTRRSLLGSSLLGIAAITAKPASAQNRYDPGANDSEIKIGNIMPYSGPASAWGVVGRTEAVYFDKINDEGGINGRKITFISYDDAYSPPKTVEQARKLVESDGVLLIFNSLGTPSNTAIQKYLNARKVPQLPPAPPNGTIPSISPGRWVSRQATNSKAGSIQDISSAIIRAAASASFTRTTTTGRTMSKGSRTGSTAECRS
jgi:ABC-type branched-subunit amino acid transport system substrate-binding protein